jgi:Tfp pilus assembly protein PilX
MLRQDARLKKSIRRSKDRQGFVLVTVITIMAISMALFAIWARGSVLEHQRAANQQLRLQAVRLAEAGLQRAIAQLVGNSDYEGETWTVSAADLDQVHSAEVRMRITRSDDHNTVRIEATAEFPASADRRAQSTKRIEIPNSNSGTKP